MSELQIGLLMLGGAFIALVLGVNLYQEWRFKKKTRQAFTRGHSDVLLEVPKNNVRDGVAHDRLEPVMAVPLDLPDLPDLTETVPEAQPVEAAAAPLPEPEEIRLDMAQSIDSDDHQALVVAMLDPTLDFIAEVVFRTPYQLKALPRFAVAKRVQLIGRTEHGLWKPAEALPGVRYKQLNIGLQLVDRGGAVNEQEIASFCQQVARFAEENEAAVSFPQRAQKLVAARELDRFCADVDMLIGINILPRAPIAGAQLRDFVEACGLQLEHDGTFHCLSDSGNTLFSLTSSDQTPFSAAMLSSRHIAGLTLLFDVPRVAGAVEVFDRAVEFSRELAAEFDAQLVDDNRRVLSQQGLDRIREQLAQIYGNMDDRGIAPGSFAALRLFA
ncbi:cell division protein ZipA C-terminal FtsZ-binding domain-containing protein [Craterilacuibacter sp.]|uniref:cell division protein ZipA C-terminal FtsZ-binding domain-containing protein n=1 Tax=Craterilacuibacter sp. TaxID=2870909 RepID=UPI003F380DEF